MLVSAKNLLNTKILSVQTSSAIGVITNIIVDPDNLKIIAFYIEGPLISKTAYILDVNSIREYSRYGMVIDSIDELVEKEDVIKISNVIDLDFSLTGLKVETKKGSKLGKVTDFNVTNNDYMVQQLIVKRPALKGFIDPELTIPRKEIIEVNDYKVIVKDEEKIIKKKAVSEDFVPNFVNPFRKNEQDFVPARTKTPADKDTE